MRWWRNWRRRGQRADVVGHMATPFTTQATRDQFTAEKSRLEAEVQRLREEIRLLLLERVRKE